MCEEIWEAASQAIIDAANRSGDGGLARVVTDPSWAVRFRQVCEEWWRRNIAQDWEAAFQNPDTTPPQEALPDGLLLGTIADMVRTATFLATNTPPATNPLPFGTDPIPHEFEVGDLVRAGQDAARNLLRRRH